MRQNLKIARMRKHMTQTDMAKLLAVTPRQYRAIESGASNGSIKLWQEIKRVLGGTIDDLLQDDSIISREGENDQNHD